MWCCLSCTDRVSVCICSCFQVVYVTLLLFQGVSDIILEEVVLDLNLLDSVGCLLDCGGLGLVDFCLLCCEVESSFDAKCGGQVGVEGGLPLPSALGCEGAQNVDMYVCHRNLLRASPW